MRGMTQSLNVSVACAVMLAQVDAAARGGGTTLCPLSEEEQLHNLSKWLMRDVRASRAMLRRCGIDVEEFM